MTIIIKKIGGTSVVTNNDRENIYKSVTKDITNGYTPVLVVSAIGRSGQPYATDTLINLYKQINKKGQQRDIDLLMSCGEIISSTLISAYLNNKGISALAVTGFQAGIITDNNYGKAKVLEVDTTYLDSLIKSGIVPVISGFQGISLDGNITTLGRGGSDTTAALIGEALKAKRIEIITDVEGVMTADPKIVEKATIISNMTYDELYEMSKQGAKVVDFNAVDIARRSNIDLVVRNSSNSDKGTLIALNVETNRILTAVTHSNKWIQYKIDYSSNDCKDILFMDLLQENGISIDMINFFENHKYFIVKESVENKLDILLNNLNLQYIKKSNCSKVTIVGHKIHGVVGIMRRVVTALENASTKILQTSDSNMTISCLIDSCDSNKALISLHKEFNLDS